MEDVDYLLGVIENDPVPSLSYLVGRLLIDALNKEVRHGFLIKFQKIK